MIEYLEDIKDKKIIAIGNPPYQELDNGFGASAKALYPLFIDCLVNTLEIKKINFIIPSRWFRGGKNLDKFRDWAFACNQIKAIKYFDDSRELFPDVLIDGGICYFLWEHTPTPTTFFTNKYGIATEISLESEARANGGIFIPYPVTLSIVKKIKDISQGRSIVELRRGREWFCHRGINSKYFKVNPESKDNDALDCFNYNPSQGRNIKKITKNIVNKNHGDVLKYKVYTPNAMGCGEKNSYVPSRNFIAIPNQVATCSYNLVAVFETYDEAKNFLNFLSTHLVSYLVTLRKGDKSLSADTWSWVPLLDFSKPWTDHNLFEYFKLTNKEIQSIVQSSLF